MAYWTTLKKNQDMELTVESSCINTSSVSILSTQDIHLVAGRTTRTISIAGSNEDALLLIFDLPEESGPSLKATISQGTTTSTRMLTNDKTLFVVLT